MGPVNMRKTNQTDITQNLDQTEGDMERRMPVSYLVVLAGDSVGRVVRLESETCHKAGRSRSCDLFFDCDNISREHAQFELDSAGRALLRDLGSTNGTQLNGKKVAQAPLQDGDRICLGNVILRYSRKDGLEYDFQQSLYEKATRDPLTGCFNKRFLMESLQKEFAFHNRQKQPLSLMIMDLDDFKKINDTHGHINGDIVLKRLASEAQSILRQEDLLARFGGEEFVTLFRFTDREAALAVSEKVLEKISSLRFETGEGAFGVTVTVGVATLVERNFNSSDALLMAADNNLYLGKHDGKNRVIG